MSAPATASPEGNLPYAHLHVHTEYSMLDGAARFKDLFKEVKALGMTHVAMTDHGNLFGAAEFYRQAMDAGITPVIGIEAYVAPERRDNPGKILWGQPHQKKDNVAASGAYVHKTIWAQNKEGLLNLFKISSRSLIRISLIRRIQLERTFCGIDGRKNTGSDIQEFPGGAYFRLESRFAASIRSRVGVVAQSRLGRHGKWWASTPTLRERCPRKNASRHLVPSSSILLASSSVRVILHPDISFNFAQELFMKLPKTSRRRFLQASGIGAKSGRPGLGRRQRQARRIRQGGRLKEMLHFLAPVRRPSHLDTWDLKPNAVPEIRGPYKPIRSKMPGMQLSELHPMLSG